MFVPGEASPSFCCPGGVIAAATTEVVETGADFGHRGDEADNGAKLGAPALRQSFGKNSPRKGST